MNRVFHDANPEPGKASFEAMKYDQAVLLRHIKPAFLMGQCIALPGQKRGSFKDLPPYLTLLLKTGRQKLKNSWLE